MPKKTYYKKKAPAKKTAQKKVDKKQAKAIVKKAETRSPFNVYEQICKRNDRLGTMQLLKNDTVYVTYNAGVLSVVDNGGTSLIYSAITGSGWINSAVGTLAIPGINSAWSSLGFLFRLGDLLNSAKYQPLFDQYKFIKSRCKIALLSDYLISSDNTQRGLIPEVYFVHDNDDAIAIPSYDEVVTRIGATPKRLTSQGSQQMTTFTPKHANIAYQSTPFLNGYSQGSPEWIDSQYPNVEHYGLKLMINNMIFNTESSGAPIIRIDFEHILMFRGMV